MPFLQEVSRKKTVKTASRRGVRKKVTGKDKNCCTKKLTNTLCCIILSTVMENEEYTLSAPEELLGAEIDGYRLESLLGCGSYGVVYLARHIMMDRLFAFKILQAEFSEDNDSIRGFFRESKTAAKLEHPNVVQAVQAGKTPEGLCYFVMEYVDGSSIEDIRVNSPELLSLEFMLELSIQLADALDYAWNTRKIIHRDIKPDNLLVCRADRKLKLADLGLAGVNAGNTDEIVATPLYMAPEIAAGLGSSEMTSDIYSFGVMFYELSSGVPPFTGSIEELQRAHLEDIPEPLLVANPDLDPELARYIDSMLAKDPGARPQSWSEVKERLSAIKERLYASQRYPLPRVDEKSGRALSQNDANAPGNAKWLWIIVALIAAAALLTVILLLVF